MFVKFKRWLRGHSSPSSLHFSPQSLVIGNQRFVMRTAIAKDVSKMVQIEQDIFGTPPWGAAAFELELSRQRDRLYLVVLNERDQLVGYAGCSFNWFHSESHITNIAIEPAFQNLGIGTALIRTLQEYSRAQGILSMSLEVRASNLSARQLYERLGFRQHQLKRGYYLDDREDAVEMKLKLTK